ncbi:hypothetical protein QTJ16_004311 [Diplocarpon rosae]|uniref:C2H2-type domain-containing protein n=1 Tax=Diplocarpon rosae TaxID=946125 RepID=A0AAD9SZY4_9HELO|nr:hypothetical protein QTJ16_004311 [Diplocarpon rosae]
MTMTLDNQQRFGGMSFDHMSFSNPPQFTNPWSGSTPSPNHSLYAPSHTIHPSLGLDIKHAQQHQHHASRMNSTSSVGSYAGISLGAASSAGSPLMADVYGTQDLLTMPHNLLSPRSGSSGYADGHAAYSSAPEPAHNAYVPTSTPYENMGYAPAPVRSTYALPQDSRRLSQPSVPSNSFPDDTQRSHRQHSLADFDERGLQNEAPRSFGDAIDASRGMIAMSQTTPRNIYEAQVGRVRGSGDAYGFPTTHSSSSSISSSSNYATYYGSGSVESSVSDYSNASSDIESVSSRTLPRPSGLLNGGMPPAPASMMGQFSSKVSSTTQKKHKCKVCDKRFTRPSSLQTHMYSHTGEKPFCCEVEGCGRHFSVVSNLRRHRKVHKGEARSDAGSEDHHSDD